MPARPVRSPGCALPIVAARAADIKSPSGGAYDNSAAHFLQSSELGYLNPDRSVTGTGAFATA